MCSHFFNAMDLHVSTFFFFFHTFSYPYVSSAKTYLEGDHNFLENGELILVEMNGVFSCTSSVEATHICVVYVILILGA